VSSTDSLDDASILNSVPNGVEGTSATDTTETTGKPPCAKKPKFKDPNANFQRLNMRKKQYTQAKKHQFGRNKRNAFYRRTRNAGAHK
jgi:hypothetical protein